MHYRTIQVQRKMHTDSLTLCRHTGD